VDINFLDGKVVIASVKAGYVPVFELGSICTLQVQTDFQCIDSLHTIAVLWCSLVGFVPSLVRLMAETEFSRHAAM
jgi:hypothetical protein